MRRQPSLVAWIVCASCTVHEPARVAVAEPAPPAAPGAAPAVAVRSEPVQVAANDPAAVAGEWSYRTTSNCGSVVGTGEVRFAWDATAETYTEAGWVYWADSGARIDWWGHVRFDAATRSLHGEISNSLGDSVLAKWELEGAPPRRLTIRWVQTNGCVGEGVATRR
jgi:hypothetical protein